MIKDLLEQTDNHPWSDSLQQLNNALLQSTFEHKVLTFEDAKKLSDLYRRISNQSEFEGIYLDRNQAREILIMRNLKLVRRIALSMRNHFNHVEIEDLFQSGILGLIRAVEKWDPAREFQFSTYATWHIRQSITRFTLDNYFQIRIPIYLSDKLLRVKAYLTQYIEFFEFEPETLEAADSLEITEDEYLTCREAIFSFISFEKEVESNSLFLETLNSRQESCELFTDPSKYLELELLSQDLFRILNTLSEREAGVIALRFGLVGGKCHSLDEIGKVYGVTRERIRQIESKTMSKLRHPARTEILHEYLDFEEARWENPLARRRNLRMPNFMHEDLEEDEGLVIVSSDLYCGDS